MCNWTGSYFASGFSALSAALNEDLLYLHTVWTAIPPPHTSIQDPYREPPPQATLLLPSINYDIIPNKGGVVVKRWMDGWRVVKRLDTNLSLALSE